MHYTRNSVYCDRLTYVLFKDNYSSFESSFLHRIQRFNKYQAFKCIQKHSRFSDAFIIINTVTSDEIFLITNTIIL